MSDPIVAKGIVKGYRSGSGDLEVLKGIDLVIEPGELVAIHGPSGVGKSTLLHILGTLDRPTGGTLSYGELDIGNLSDRVLARLRNERIGFIFQFYHLLPEFTAFENVLLPAMVNGEQLEEAGKRARRLLDEVGLSERQTHKPDALSGGEQQRVAIARALINRPEVVFADEPTGNLDEENSREIYSLIKRLTEEHGTSFVVVTHEPSLASVSHRSLGMANGRIESD